MSAPRGLRSLVRHYALSIVGWTTFDDFFSAGFSSRAASASISSFLDLLIGFAAASFSAGLRISVVTIRSPLPNTMTLR